METENVNVTTTDSPRSDKKYFTVREANRALPYVSRIVEDVTSAYMRLVDLQQSLDGTDPSSRTKEIVRDYEVEMDRLSGLVNELLTVGVELKDFELGLVDFPARHEDRNVLLCWKKGEQRIEHWHEVNSGYGGRQSLELLGEKASPS